MRPEMTPEEHDKCASVLERVHDFLDAELSDTDGDVIRLHLNECEQCLDEYDTEQEIKQLVQRCCGGSAPDGLRDKVRTKLQQAQSSHREAAES
ncbi:MAG: mycothiol system anti-sigma-R factor [Propionibacteriales bacterium]|nr:mycothiol system anti-sigma-R factor [Propionibacteriales bacterium]